MCGVLDVRAAMTPKLTLGYRHAVAVADSVLARAGDVVRGHEFHRTATVPASGNKPAWRFGAASRRSRHRIRRRLLPAHALGGHPAAAARFTAACAGRAHMTKRLIGVGVGPRRPGACHGQGRPGAPRGRRGVGPGAGRPRSRQPRSRQPSSEPGRAETIIRAYVAAGRVKRLEFALNDTGGVTPRRAAAWQAAAAAVAAEFAAGAATVAFGTLGDPNLYSTFSYLAQTVRDLVPEVTVETVAGITAMQDLASRAGISLAEGTEPVTLVPLNGGVGALDQALARGGTVVGYKVGAAASPAPGVLRERLQRPAAWTAPSSAPASACRRARRPRRRSPAPRRSPRPRRPCPPPAPASPAPASMDMPDIPYLSTLIVPALRPPASGAALRPAAAEHANSNDVSIVVAGATYDVTSVSLVRGGSAAAPGPPKELALRTGDRPSDRTAPARGVWCSSGPGPAPRTC